MILEMEGLEEVYGHYEGYKWLMSKIDQVENLTERDILAILKKHPFGLPTLNQSWIQFIKASGGITVVENFAILIAKELYLNLSEDKNHPAITHLRKIHAQCDTAHSTHHYIFYEVATPNNVYMNGDSTDCSGHGKRCKAKMDSLFEFLADLFNLQIETIEIPYFKYKKGRDFIRQEEIKHNRILQDCEAEK